MPKKYYDKLYLTLQKLKVELYLSYRDMGFNASIVNSIIRWYELATYTIEENNGNFLKVYLYLNDFITIQDEEFKESYAIVKGIFRYKGNNKNDYAFIVVDQFENIKKD